MIRPYVSHVITLLPGVSVYGSDDDSVRVFGCSTMGRRFMQQTIHEYCPTERKLNAIEWYSHVPEEYRALVMEVSKEAFKEVGFIKCTSDDVHLFVDEWHRQIWLTVAREGLAE